MVSTTLFDLICCPGWLLCRLQLPDGCGTQSVARRCIPANCHSLEAAAPKATSTPTTKLVCMKTTGAARPRTGTGRLRHLTPRFQVGPCSISLCCWWLLIVCVAGVCRSCIKPAHASRYEATANHCVPRLERCWYVRVTRAALRGDATHARLSRQIVTDQAVHGGPVHGWCVLCPRGCVARVLVWNSRCPALCQRTPPRLKTRFEKKRAGPASLWIWSFATLQGNLRALYSSFSLELACMATCTFPPVPRHEVPRRHSTGCCSQDYVQRHQPAIVA